MASITRELRGRPVTAEEAKVSVQRLINSHFHNKDSARCSIPTRADDDDIVASDWVQESIERISELEAKLAALDWTPITESNLPKLGDEVGRQNSSGIWLASTVETNADYRFWDALGYTHFRPINPPVQP